MAIQERGFMMKTLNCVIIILLTAVTVFADSEALVHIKKIVDDFTTNYRESNILLKQDCDQIILASDKDGAFGQITDYNDRFQWFLASSYYFETEPDTTPPLKGLNLDYRPSADQAKLFPGYMGMWYKYPTNIEEWKTIMVSALRSSSGSSFTVLKDEKATKYAKTEGYNYICKFLSGTTTLVWDTHLVCVNGVGFFIFYIGSESDYKNSLKRILYDLILSSFSIATQQTHATKTWHYQPDNFSLSQNFPNPFNGSTTFQFQIDRPQNVDLDIYDQTGRLVKNLFKKYYDAGTHSTNINASGLPSGCYFGVLTGENQKSIKKILLIK